ncbi:hypothetical protein PAXINDRAFT_20714 [Paxillus involutus ATCC 200175]|uniref:Unplaced genomic scaffold PAXINscaffold_1209, whole genome shotgun sequence n=1 Tax=Paxillus involutus ATCC 200175 TaxID=664439 RepID=A0A0C9SMF3_PAXIN|nr:hypothetical protein PAXINDRAFT_20714 [Paxillus involutus ATCC 200175]
MTTRPPLAGKPPFATDDPDSLFEQPPPSKRRVRKPAEPDPNSRTSAYNMYDSYLDNVSNRQSGLGAVGLGLMSGTLDDDNDAQYPPQKHGEAALMHPTAPQQAQAIPLAAPRPGYPAPVANLKIPSPSPSASPEAQRLEPPQMGQVPQALRVTRPQADLGAPRMPPPIYQTATPRPSVPSTPHPLQPPMTPITPVFARPSKSPAPSDVKFTSDVIMRGNSEDNLLPKRGEHGDDFWRRFSMVAKEEKKPSSWLTKTQNGSSRLSRWVWFIGVVLFICIGVGSGVGWYLSHKSPSNQQPTAVGGSANETTGPNSPTTAANGHSTSSSLHVTPTNTVARRAAMPDPTPAPVEAIYIPSEEVAQPNVSRHGKKHRLRHF